MSNEQVKETTAPESTDNFQEPVAEQGGQNVEAQPESVPFIETLPESIREMPEFSGIADAEGFLNRVQDLAKGPQAPEDYDLPEIENGDDLLQAFKQTAKEANLTQDQAENVLKMWESVTEKAKQDREQLYAASITSLQDNWGKDFESNLDVARNAVEHFVGKELKDYLNDTGLGNHKALVEAFHAIGIALQEDVTEGAKNDSSKSQEVERWNGIPLLNFDM